MLAQYTPPASSMLPERFWQKVQITDGCWLWLAAKNRRGYGVIGVAGRRTALAHRLLYTALIGPIPAGRFILHRCDNPGCVRPDHLHVGDHRENMREMRERGRSNTGDRNSSHRHPERVPRGERHHQARLTAEHVRQIRARRAAGERLGPIAADFGIDPSLVCAIARRRAWKHVP